MSWQKWVLMAIYAMNLICVVAAIGRPVRPITPHTAIYRIIGMGLGCVLVVTA